MLLRPCPNPIVEDIVDEAGLGGDFEEKKLHHRLVREAALGGSGLETTSGLGR
jgi:hypothetical protein